MQKNQKIAIITGIVLAIMTMLFAAVYYIARPQPQEGLKKFTVEVVAERDGFSDTSEYSTDEQYLGDFLDKEGLIGFETSEYGRFITSVMGHEASDADQSWWCVYVNGESAVTGVDEIVVEDGSTYRLELTIGW